MNVLGGCLEFVWNLDLLNGLKKDKNSWKSMVVRAHSNANFGREISIMIMIIITH